MADGEGPSPHWSERDFDDPIRQRMLLDALYRADFTLFGRAALPIIVPDYEPIWVADAILFQAMQFADDASKRMIINAPPRSLKTKIASSLLPAFILGQNPRARIICVSHSQPTARIFAEDTLRVMRSPFYRRLFPGTVIDRMAVEDFTTTAGGGRLATSVFGGVTGRGAEYIIVDDPIRADDVNSETIRPRVNEWFDNTLRSRLNNARTGAIMLVMQRMHEDDLTGHVLRDARKWNHLIIPAETSTHRRYELADRRVHIMRPGDLMNPNRLGRAELDNFRQASGSRVFNAQFLQDPTPAEGLTFKRDWLRYETVEHQPGDRIIQAWDCANKAGATHDYSVCITAIVRRRTILILDVFRARLEFPDLKKAVISQARIFRPQRVLIEDAASGQQLIQMLQAEHPKGVPTPIPITPINSKIDRAATAEARVEAGELILPKQALWIDEFVKELLSFPQGRHDDQVDALAHIMRHTQQDYLPSVLPGTISSSQSWRPGKLANSPASAPDIDPDIKTDWSDDPE
jgi:predicted phage terminase large subunit-like protein